jgi:hypothetical protein
MRTVPAIVEARNLVKENKNYTGDLGLSIAHQKHAVNLFKRGVYRGAIHHSRRARLLAFRAIKANNGAIRGAWRFSSDDKIAFGQIPSDSQLDSELPDQGPADDQAAQENLDDLDVDK